MFEVPNEGPAEGNLIEVEQIFWVLRKLDLNGTIDQDLFPLVALVFISSG